MRNGLILIFTIIIMENEDIKKCLKSYLMGKKYIDIDKNKAFEYFKQSLKYLSNIKNKDVKVPQPVTYATEDFTRGLSRFISNRYNKLPAPSISNAFTKLWEVLETFPSIINKESKSFKVFHICEAPGQMILATKYFASKKRHNLDMQNYDWRANSLNPYNAENKSN